MITKNRIEDSNIFSDDSKSFILEVCFDLREKESYSVRELRSAILDEIQIYLQEAKNSDEAISDIVNSAAAMLAALKEFEKFTEEA